MAVIWMKSRIWNQVQHKRLSSFESLNSCMSVLINSDNRKKNELLQSNTNIKAQNVLSPVKVNNYNDPSAEQFCTFALGNEGDKSPDKVSTTSALIYFLTLPQRPTSETECPEDQNPTESSFPTERWRSVLLLRSRVSKWGYLNSHHASSERTGIPAGEIKEEKGMEKERNKEKERKKQLWEVITLAHLHQSTHWKCMKLGFWGKTSPLYVIGSFFFFFSFLVNHGLKRLNPERTFVCERWCW